MIDKYYPEQGKLSRHNYPKHMAFFEAGKIHRERCMMAGNRVGKTDAAVYEVTCHLTGKYPLWWNGRRFNHPIDVWASGDTGTTVRDILQKKLFGSYSEPGTGFLPGQSIIRTTNKSGIREAYDTATIKHCQEGKYDGNSTLTFKSYQEGRKSFQGTAPHVLILDEEPPNDIYTECLLRTMTNKGLIILTFTPLMGITELVYSFMNETKEEFAL